MLSATGKLAWLAECESYIRCVLCVENAGELVELWQPTVCA